MRTLKFIFGLFIFSAVLFAQAPGPNPAGPGSDDPAAGGPADAPGRAVARISVLSGDASVRHGDAGDWMAVTLNAPVMAGDTLSVTPGATVELQMDEANFARIAGDSEVHIADLDNGHFQFQLSKGMVTYRTLRQSNAQGEVDTPLVAVRPVAMSSVRVEVAPDNSTRITVRHGGVQVYTPKGTEDLREGNTMVLRGSADDPEFQVNVAVAPDAWDTWNDQRDTYLLRAQSPAYVSQDVTGSEDLDNYGRWSNDPSYGQVWTPNVPATWAPYRNGQWVWNDYYGWTWVDADPWGWAPFHYGSWYFRTGFGWSWFPGARFGHYWYHPALVGFFGFGGGGFGIGFGFGNVGWVPLAPFERFRPWYGGGRALGFANVNLVRNANITNVYRNARFANGVTAVSAGDFQRGNFRNPVAVDRGQLAQASLVRGGVPMTPTASNRAFTSRTASAAGPRASVSNQRFFTPGASRSAQAGGGSAGWQRFGSGGNAGNAGGARSLQVTPPIVRQRQSSPGYAGSSNAYRGGASQGAPAYRSAPQQAPAYRSAPQQSPSYRSAPAQQGGQSPSYRSAPAPRNSAPAPAPRGGGSSGGHAQSSGGHSGGHGGGRR